MILERNCPMGDSSLSGAISELEPPESDGKPSESGEIDALTRKCFLPCLDFKFEIGWYCVIPVEDRRVLTP